MMLKGIFLLDTHATNSCFPTLLVAPVHTTISLIHLPHLPDYVLLLAPFAHPHESWPRWPVFHWITTRPVFVCHCHAQSRFTASMPFDPRRWLPVSGLDPAVIYGLARTRREGLMVAFLRFPARRPPEVPVGPRVCYRPS